MRKQISYALLALTTTILLLGTLTPFFTSLTQHLPPNFHLFFHFFAHALLVLSAQRLVSSSTPPEAIFAVSIALSIFLELVQYIFIPNRSPQLADVAASALGSFAVFISFPDGRPQTPSWTALSTWLQPDDDDDDDDDPHRVNSWAV